MVWMILAILSYTYIWGGQSSTSTAPDSEFCPHGYGQKKTQHKRKGMWTLVSQKKRIQTSTLTTQGILSSLSLHPVMSRRCLRSQVLCLGGLYFRTSALPRTDTWQAPDLTHGMDTTQKNMTV